MRELHFHVQGDDLYFDGQLIATFAPGVWPTLRGELEDWFNDRSFDCCGLAERDGYLGGHADGYLDGHADGYREASTYDPN